MYFEALKRLDNQITLLWLHSESDEERILAWFERTTPDDSKEELKDWIRKWQVNK